MLMQSFSSLIFPIKVDFLPFIPCIIHEIIFLVYFIGIYMTGSQGPCKVYCVLKPAIVSQNRKPLETCSLAHNDPHSILYQKIRGL